MQQRLGNLGFIGRLSALAGLIAWTAVVVAFRAVADAAEPSQVAAQAESRRAAASVEVSWILASDDKPWTVALATPAAAHLRKSTSDPPAGKERIRLPDQSQPAGLVMAISSPPTREAQRLLSLAPGPRPIVLATSDPWKPGPLLQERSPDVLQIGSDPSAASATVAKRFWRQSREVVVALADDPEAVILGSALAAGLDVPILLCDQEQAGAAVSAALKDLSVARMLVAVSDANEVAPLDSDSRRSPSRSCRPRPCSTG